MTITYTTRVIGLRVRNEGSLTDVVRVAEYNVTGVDGEFRHDVGATHQFSGEVDAEAFTPMEELTEAQVVGWLESDPNILAGVKGNIAYFIERKKAEAQLVNKPAPWLPVVPLPPAMEVPGAAS